MDQIITVCRKALKLQIKNTTQLEISLLEQELKHNYTEAISIVARGFVINMNHITNIGTVVATLMDRYYEWLLKYTRTDQTQFNEA